MAEDTLISALEEDAKAQAGRVLEEAREAAEALLAAAREEMAAEERSRALGLEEALRRKRAALLNAGRTRASGEKLKVRHRLIERAMDEAGKRFTRMPQEEYRSLLNRLFLELRAEWEGGRPGEAAVVFVNPADVGLIEGPYEVRGDERVVQGVAFASRDGAVRFENSVQGRLSRARSVMLPALNEMLFGEVFT